MLKKNIKKTWIVFVLILLTKITSFSQTTSTQIEPDSIAVSITDLKYANLIFAEHKKLLLENKYLYDQVDNLNHLNIQNQRIEELRLQQINEYEALNQQQINKITDLEKELKKKKNRLVAWEVGGVTVTVGLILFLLLK